MKIEFTGRHLDVTPALREHVNEHLERIGHLFSGNNTKVHVIIEVERGRHRSEIVVKWRNEVLTAASTLSDMYQSLSKSIAKIEKQALKLKNKVIDKSHRARKVGAIAAKSAVRPIPSAPRIIKSRNYRVKPMTTEEASLLLSDGDDGFLVFRNASGGRVSVLYKRKDKNFGLIEP